MAFAVLLAAGSSERFGGQDKLQAKLPDGRPLWRRPFDVLRACEGVDGVGIVCRAGQEQLFSGVGADFVVPGGQTRRESSIIGAGHAPDGLLLIHDAARAMVDKELVLRVLLAGLEVGAAVPLIPVVDTIKRVSGAKLETLDRDSLRAAQTPQAARKDWLLEALQACPDATDEAMALESMGRPVAAVEGNPTNFKVTTAADLDRMRVTSGMASVTGFGYDVHQFSSEAGRPLLLGGVHFAGERGLDGHSDADVVLHAITDALLGTVGEGDIGQLFPNTDPRWKGADSRLFLREACSRVQQAGGSVLCVDVTVIAEAPKLGPRSGEMRRAIAREIGVDERQVNIKATTAEGMGALGRGEGIAAMAVATVLRHRSFTEVE
jgi:2-C-methyl-D-erythritol 4-phosphate cytidylyltransferase/2-C-methyl-D-erythritol 2,4-cyclodiphosphate synthase